MFSKNGQPSDHKTQRRLISHHPLLLPVHSFSSWLVPFSSECFSVSENLLFICWAVFSHWTLSSRTAGTSSALSPALSVPFTWFSACVHDRHSINICGEVRAPTSEVHIQDIYMRFLPIQKSLNPIKARSQTSWKNQQPQNSAVHSVTKRTQTMMLGNDFYSLHFMMPLQSFSSGKSYTSFSGSSLVSYN